MFDVDEGGGLGIERIPGPSHGDDPSTEGSVLGDVGQGPKPDAHLVQAEGVRSGKAHTGDAQLRAQRTLRKGHVSTVGGEVRLALGLWSHHRC